MRRGTNPKFIHITADGQVLTPNRNNSDQSAVLDLSPDTRILGVNFGSDYCSEHEWGIKGLYTAFGVKSEIGVYGLKRRVITSVPKTLVWVKLPDGREGFAFSNHWWDDPSVILKDNSEIRERQVFDRPTKKMKDAPMQLICAWSDSDFGAFSKNPNDVQMLRDIFEQFEKKNIVFTFSSAFPVFDNPGLIIAIADRLPKEVLQMWTDADKNSHEVEKFVVKSGIRETLQTAGKGYFALSPKKNEDGTVRFWLNPREQNKNNSGWYTLDDLQAWAKNEGPIPKTNF